MRMETANEEGARGLSNLPSGILFPGQFFSSNTSTRNWQGVFVVRPRNPFPFFFFFLSFFPVSNLPYENKKPTGAQTDANGNGILKF